MEQLAQQTGISRSTLSRIERGEVSPTAAMLSSLCAQYGWTLSRLIAEAEKGPPSLVTVKEQVIWRDPDTQYIRRILSPPHPDLRGELVEISLPPGCSISYDTSPLSGLEHHLWMLEGGLSLNVEGKQFHLSKGDCLRYILFSKSKFVCDPHVEARYLVFMVHA